VPTEFPPAPYVDRPLVRGFRARLAARVLALCGWRVRFLQPMPTHCVVVVYPHTSNWDFPIGLLAKWQLGVPFRFIGKHTLFAGPLGPLMRRWGGIPLDRRESSGNIEKLAARFREEPDFRLSIAPEGTRSRTGHWKSGFYHIARAADVPLALAFIDYSRREVGVGAYLQTTGDVAADMARIASFYADMVGKRPDLASPVRMSDAAVAKPAEPAQPMRSPHAR
jgi:1-acyl-sn-glycerol-3-phosphate acyltransferase